MSKKILIRFLTIILIAILGYSVFWFYKAGQLEKTINNLVSSNSSTISIGSFDVSGFPLSQTIVFRDVKFSAPNFVVSKNKIMVKKIEAKSEMFKGEFDLKLVGEVIIIDENKKSSNIDFNQKPNAKISVSGDKLIDFRYSDNGYRVFNDKKELVYRSSSSNISYRSSADSAGKITARVNINVKEAEGFDIINVYKNAFEDKVIDDIKTGNIKLGSSIAKSFIGDQFSIASHNQAVLQQDLKDQDPAQNISAENIDNQQNKAEEIANNNNIEDKNIVVANETQPIQEVVKQKEEIVDVKNNIVTDKSNDNPKPENNDVATNKIAVSAPKSEVIEDKPLEMNKDQLANDNVETKTDEIKKVEVLKEIDSLIEEKVEEIAKNDIMIDLEYYLTPVDSEQKLALPLDPNKLQAMEVKYNKSYKINKAQITNSLFSITINGQVNQFNDDVKASGFGTVKIDNVKNFSSYLENSLKNIADDNHSKLGSVDASASNDGEISQDAYSDFLRKISVNVSTILPEIALKNQLSTEETAVLELRREKNLDVVVNETPMREILGKF